MNDGRAMIRHALPAVVTLEDTARMFQADLPAFSDADLAQTLGEIRALRDSPLAAVIEPLARAELARRRSIR